MSHPREFASPVCSDNEADDAYMGFATRAEIAAFLKELGPKGVYDVAE